MSDISEQQMNELLLSMNKSAGSLGKLAEKFGDNSTGKVQARDTILNDFRTAQKDDTRATKDHKSAIDHTTDALKSMGTRFAAFFAPVAIAGMVKNYGDNLNATYTDLSNFGQSFAGDILKLGQQAAAAGLPLQEFRDAIKHNSVVVNQMGTQNFFKLAKNVRMLTERSAMYGMTLDQINNMQSDYLETQRLAGRNLAQMSNPATARQIQRFALNVTAVSDALGAEREEVLRRTRENMQQENVTSQARLNNMRGMTAYNDAMQEAVSALAAQPGMAGEMLSKGLADAFGSINGSLFTDLGREFVQAGQAGGLSLIDEANRRIQAGEDAQTVAMETVSNLKKMLDNPETLESLRLQAQTGNEAAKRILQMTTQLREYTAADVKRAAESRKNASMLTSFMQSFGSVWGRLKGALIEGFLKPFTDGMGNLDPDKVEAFWKKVEELAPAFQAFGERIGQFIAAFVNKESLQTAVETITTIATVGMSVAKFVGDVIGGFTSVFKFIHDGLKMFGDRTAAVGTVLAGLTAWFAGKALINAMMGVFGRMISAPLVNVRGGVVNVNGAGGGLGDIGDFGGDGKKGGKRGRGGAARRGGTRLRAAGRAMGRSRIGRGVAAAGGAVAGAAKRIPGISKLGGIAEGVMGWGSKLGPAVGKAAKVLGPVGLAIGAAFTLADAASAVKDIQEKVSSGKMTAEEGRKALGKIRGGAAGTLAGGAVGALIGQALIPIPGVGAVIGATAGSIAGNWLGEKAGGWVAAKLPAPAQAASAPGKASAAGGPQSGPRPVQPRSFDENKLAQIRTDALLGDKQAVEQLKKIESMIDKQTVVLARHSSMNTDAVRQTGSILAETRGY